MYLICWRIRNCSLRKSNFEQKMDGNFMSDRHEETDDTESSMDKTSVKIEDVDYTCFICEDTFAREVLLFDHYSAVHSDEVVNFWKICHLEFSTEPTFKIHNSVFHSGQRISYQGGLSPQQSREQLQSSPSNERTNDMLPYACNVCEARFFHENLLSEHTKDHTEDKPYEHLRCGYKIFNTSDLKINLTTKQRTKKEFACDTCESMFRSNASFKEHHTQCVSEFSSPSSSNLPPVTNTDKVCNTRNDCNVCKAQFLSENLLVQHGNDFPCTKIHNQCTPEIRCRSSPDLVSNVDKESDHCSYICDVCEAQFFCEDQLAQHVSKHTNGPPAEAKLGSTNSLRVHSDKPKDQKRFECPFCDKKFAFRYFQKEHMRVHTGEKPFECETCGKKFSHRNALREHSQRHHDDKSVKDGAEEDHARYKCPKCDEEFPAMPRLKTHLSVHHNVKKSFTCTSCNSVFVSVSLLKNHHLKCLPKYQFSCNVCETKFSNKRLLHSHLSKHRAEKRFECGMCEKKFAFEYLLREHLPKHTREKPFECEKCNKSFAYKASLRAHKRQAHGDNSAVNNPVEEEVEDHQCDICGKTFRKKRLLQTHLQNHRAKEEKKFKCPLCDKRFPYNYLMVRHLERHTGENTLIKCDKNVSYKG